MIADFTITIHSEPPRNVQVIVHDNVRALRSAITKWDKKRGAKPADHSETLGVCHRFNMMNDPLCALVRLAPPHIGIGVVSHEMAHAAVWIHELDGKFKQPLDCLNDEQFAWVLGELVRQTVNKLYEKGVYEGR
jgi:hypothetical protein